MLILTAGETTTSKSESWADSFIPHVKHPELILLRSSLQLLQSKPVKQIDFPSPGSPVGDCAEIRFLQSKGFPWRNKMPVCHLSLRQTDAVVSWCDMLLCQAKRRSLRCVVLHVNTVTLHKWRVCFFKAEQPCLLLMNYLEGWGKHDAFRGELGRRCAARERTQAKSEEHLGGTAFGNEGMHYTWM